MKKRTPITLIVALLLSLFLSPEASSKKATIFPYNNWQIFHLRGPEQVLTYDYETFFLPYEINQNLLGSGLITFDEAGNVITYTSRIGDYKYKYSKDGYTVHLNHGGKIGKWKVICDTKNRTRKDIYLEKYPKDRSYTYTFDAYNRHKSTLYTEKGWKALVIFHYPDEPAFKPGKGWKAHDYGRVNGSRSSIWYNKVNKEGRWLRQTRPGSDTGYYTAHYVLSGSYNGGEGVILQQVIESLSRYIRGDNYTSRALGEEVKKGSTDFDKELAALGVFDSEGRLLSENEAEAQEDKKDNPYQVKSSGKGTWGIMKSSADRMIDQRFLYQFIDIPKKTQTIISHILSAILCLFALFYASLLFGDENFGTYKDSEDVNVGRTAVLILSLCELALFYLCPDGEGFLFKMEGIWALIPLVGMLVLFVGQVSSTKRLLNLGSHFSGRDAPYEFTYFGLLIYMLALIVSLFAENLRPYAVIIGFGVIALQIVVDLIATIARRASFIRFLLNAIWMVICGSAIMLLAYAFVVMFVIVFLGYAFLSGITHRESACCSNCRTYCDGFCYYRNESVSGGGHCNKHEW